MMVIVVRAKSTITNISCILKNTKSLPSFIRSLKIRLDKDPDYERAIARYKSQGFRNWEDSLWMKVVPVNFHTHHKEMLAHSKMLLERGNIAINPKFGKLITALRTAADNEESLDKEAT